MSTTERTKNRKSSQAVRSPVLRTTNCELFLLLLRLRRLAGHLQVILHAEDAGDAVGAQKSCLLVGLRVNRSVEFHVSVLHRDADRLFGVDGVLVERRISVDR